MNPNLYSEPLSLEWSINIGFSALILSLIIMAYFYYFKNKLDNEWLTKFVKILGIATTFIMLLQMISWIWPYKNLIQENLVSFNMGMALAEENILKNSSALLPLLLITLLLTWLRYYLMKRSVIA